MNATYGFQATMTARPGKGDALVTLLLGATTGTGPANNEDCVLYLVGRSTSNPDLVQVTEGWTSKEAHAENFARPQSQAFVASLAQLLDGHAEVRDLVPVGGAWREGGSR